MIISTDPQMDAALAHLAAADPVLGRLAQSYTPRTPHPERNLFHSLASAIVGQQISGKAASAIMRRLIETCAADGELTPEGVLAVEHEALRGAGLSNAKARYIAALALAVTDGTVELDRLADLDDEAVIAQLTQVKGIGRWTAEMILAFSLDRPDVLSVGDLGIRTAVMRHYGLEALPGPDQLRAIGQPWQPHRTAAMLLLWQSLDNAPAL